MNRQLIALAVVAVTSSLHGARAVPSPAQLQKQILQAADAERSVHYIAVQTKSEPRTRLVIVGDAARNEGIQRIAFSRAGRTGHIVAVVAARIAYFRGDAFTLAHYVGLPKALAARYAGRWISVSPASPAYQTVAAGVSLASTISALKLARPLARCPATLIKGRRVISICGRVPGPKGRYARGVLYALADRPRLPVRETVTREGVRLVAAFSGWGESIRLPSIRGATPISKLKAAGPTA